MSINLNLLGDFGESIKEYSYDDFYNSCVKMVENVISSDVKDRDLYLNIYQSYQEGKYKYMDMFVCACLKCQVDLIMDSIKRKGFDKKGASIFTLKAVGDRANDMDAYIFDENGILGSVGMFLNNISFEEIRKVIYDVVGFEYVSQEDLVKDLHNNDKTKREKTMLLCKNGYGFDGKTFLMDVRMDSLEDLEKAYSLCKVKHSKKTKKLFDD